MALVAGGMGLEEQFMWYAASKIIRIARNPFDNLASRFLGYVCFGLEYGHLPVLLIYRLPRHPYVLFLRTDVARG